MFDSSANSDKTAKLEASEVLEIGSIILYTLNLQSINVKSTVRQIRNRYTV